LLLIERACAGLSSEQAAAEALGVRCLGAVPAEMPPDRVDPPLMRWMIYESVRAIVAAAALDVRSASCTVVLVTSSVPDEGKSLFTTTLAGVMADSGLRVLVLDAVPRLQPGASSSRNVSWSTMPDVDGEPFRTVALCVNERLPPSGHFEEELASARGRYDLILIKAPAVLMLSDAIRLARLSDVAVFLTHWRKTRVKTVTRAVHRLREAGIRLSGVVLTNVELPRSRSAQDPIPGYYLSSRQDEGGVRPGATI
jgi:hypothetical protein